MGRKPALGEVKFCINIYFVPKEVEDAPAFAKSVKNTISEALKDMNLIQSFDFFDTLILLPFSVKDKKIDILDKG